MRALRVGAVLLVVVSFLFPASALAEGDMAAAGVRRTVSASRYFPPTGHNVDGAFLNFFERYGGVDTFGYPITEALEEDGRLVQYFQRHRMEYWPENPVKWQVQLSLLGDLVLGPADPPQPPPTDPSLLYFAETGHAVGAQFRQFFVANGGLVVFGYPTSEAYQDGGLLVQRFQRARLEYRPENPAPFQVQPGLLGVTYLERLGPAVPALTAAVAPLQAEAGWFLWGSWTTSTVGFLPFKLHNNALAVGAIDGAVLRPGETYNFNRALTVPGYVKGLGYGPDNTYVWLMAGGVCASATGLYRAVYNAGLPILQVYPHSLASYPPYGWDATAEEGRLDLVFRNDTATDLRLRAQLNADMQEMVYWVEGRQPPDRTVVRRGPITTGKWAYEVYRDITWVDGRRLTERRVVRYVDEAPPLPEVLPPQ